MSKLRAYPPEDLPEATIESIIAHTKDYQANHGSLIKVIGSETEHSVQLHPVGVSLFPTLFPQKLFDEAVELQRIYNELYCKVAEDVHWLHGVTSPLRDTEPLVDALWTVYEEVQKRRGNGSAQFPRQDVSGGVFRSDYMLHWQEDAGEEEDTDNNNMKNKEEEIEENDLHWMSNVTLKQVEFNSYSCAGGAHANKVAEMHKFLVSRHVYHDFPLGEDDMNLQSTRENPIRRDALPKNKTIDKIAYMLAAALTEYRSASSSPSHRQPIGILMVVQPHNFNTTDERPIEYALWNWEDGGSPIPTYRVEWQDVLRYTTLTERGQLLFHPEEGQGKSIEIGVVYHRAGYEPKEYASNHGIETRIRLELSRAIKFPSVLGHITTTKKVQQALTGPGVLERWLPPESARKIRQTFVKMYPLDDGTPAGIKGVELATNDDTAVDYILKPSLEGGGHNIYGDGIPDFLISIPRSQWSAYILMERIRSPPGIYNVLMSSEGITACDVVSELGIFGTCLWRSIPKVDGRQSTCEMIKNKVGGWSFKTKDAFIDEMSVVKGFGCFDTPCLVDQ
ncbi:hypothetical protein PISL3812_01750 [Talaromyces islandicus]|uniref:Glutathione synthetase n=1 Tax=Talaromyces islandicus TaxID=28573 RepID=A0A0U1LQF0_TALIS|nr:hypothetical protein PISL3812_01750 [Talaromyces islandicus]